MKDRGTELADRYLEACKAPPSMLQVTCASPDKRDQLIEAVDGAAQKYGDFGVALRPEKRTPVPAASLRRGRLVGAGRRRRAGGPTPQKPAEGLEGFGYVQRAGRQGPPIIFVWF